MSARRNALLALSCVLGSVVRAVAAPPPPPDFNRDIRPILAAHCLKCHGPDDKQRQAGLRLDQRGDALRALASGHRAIVPGKPMASTLVGRIRATDASIMPPASANKPLNASQRRLLERWVADGARYAPHWAFVPPRSVVPPALPASLGNRVRNPIDQFVFARLHTLGLAPSPEADRTTLIRRLSLDLIGLPPTPAEVDQFLSDRRPGAYERLVDRLLASPRYGERWARRWLDLARYADTNGYEKDRPRSLWPWRDWVIRALNDDMPFDRFTVAQLAGDLLPGATDADRIATGFHRNTMRNEEGGIDPLEYRFLAQVDRMATTGTTWLGLTIGCAQCHTHKFDPLPHRDYYRLMAFLDNADEPEIAVHDKSIAEKRAVVEREIANAESELAGAWPIEHQWNWRAPAGATARSARGGPLAQGVDGRFDGPAAAPDTDTTTITVPSDGRAVGAIRLEALANDRWPRRGPGRSDGGNFVLTGIEIRADGEPVRIVAASADRSQSQFGPEGALDASSRTGWAVYQPDRPWNDDHRADFTFDVPRSAKSWTVVLKQEYGQSHVLGSFRLRLGEAEADAGGLAPEARKAQAYQAARDRWLADRSAKAVRWDVLRPVHAKASLPTLLVQPDGSVLSGGDQSKSDVSTLRFATRGRTVRALRLEVLSDPRLPKGGPGRVEYEGIPGDFFLNEFKVLVGGREVRMARANQSFAAGGNDAAKAIDNDMLTAWSIGGEGVGKSHTAVFVPAEPILASTIEIRLLCERYYSSNIGRFRISVTEDGRAWDALPADIEAALVVEEAKRDLAQSRLLERHFLSIAPELAAARARIDSLRQSLPAFPTTWVFQERPPIDPRTTRVRIRGEFLRPAEAVRPGIPAFLNPLPEGSKADRLAFAQWLVSPENPLVARVTVNRQWQAFFGRGIVATLEDFGYMGSPPTHPELLDWLARRFVADGWSMKRLHRWIVTSATYRQLSASDPVRTAKDPTNAWLSRGPRVRLDAEQIRDAALSASGLLSSKMHGPSVFPPQPPGVTSEGAYGPLDWRTSTGEDRYRRGLYTFAKRTAPYALSTTFDAGSGEACMARRDVSNTPLQALALLNDTVFAEAAAALGKSIAPLHGTDGTKVDTLFRRVLTRTPEPAERDALLGFLNRRRAAFATDGAAAKKLAGGDATKPEETAAWTLLARTVLNLDEAIVKR